MVERLAEEAESGEPHGSILVREGAPVSAGTASAPAANLTAGLASPMKARLRQWLIAAVISLTIITYLTLNWTAIGPPIRTLLGVLR